MNKIIKSNDPEILSLVRTLISAKGSPSLSIVALGRVLIVYDGTTPVRRFTCSNPLECSKTAEIIQRAYDKGYFLNCVAM